MGVKFEVKWEGASRLKKGQLKAIKKKVMEGFGNNWYTSFKNKHFTTAGAKRYNYGVRKTKNVRTGLVYKDKHHQKLAPSPLPLVWSGRSRNLSRTRTVKANSQRVDVSMPVRAFNFIPPGNKQLRMRAEFTRVIPSEIANLTKRAQRDLARAFSRFEGATTTFKYQ